VATRQLLDVCWKFAGRLLDCVNTPLMTKHLVEAVCNKPATARCPPGCWMQSFVNCSYRFAARDVLTKVHLQECFTANNSKKTKPGIDMISATQCVSRSKDAEKCKESKVKFWHLQGCCTQQTICTISNSKFFLQCSF